MRAAQTKQSFTRWRYQMETFFALLALCAGNSPATGEFPSQRPEMRCFDVFFYLRLDKRLSKQSWRRWFEAPSRSLWRHCNGGELNFVRHQPGDVYGTQIWSSLCIRMSWAGTVVTKNVVVGFPSQRSVMGWVVVFLHCNQINQLFAQQIVQAHNKKVSELHIVGPL